MRALVVEQGFSRGALAAVRALAQAGWQVGVGAPDGCGLASSSRACTRRHAVPAAHEDQPAFLAAVEQAVREGGYEVVFGAGEAEVLTLSEHRDAVAAVVPHAGHQSVLDALDKARLAEAAVAAGFGVPQTLAPASLSDETRPVVVKARMHARPGLAGAPPRIDTNVVLGATATRRRVSEIAAVGGEAEVQEFLDGYLMAYAAVTTAGGRQVAAHSMQVASRVWPPGAGASCRAVSVPVDPELAERAAALFAALGWFGLAELQFIVPADGVPRLIDLNGRFYGSLALAVRAGANLPATWAALATGRWRAPVEPVTAVGGVRYSWWEGDLRRALVERRGGVVRDLAGALYSGAGAVHSVGRWRDPAPALTHARRLLTDRRAAVSKRVHVAG
ncbi:MAG TPA: ATP-grasp domain-containing protein [Jatrophihabitans sp.]|uniref:ATP-grasp domain-containing protein n=1 Tax=Jatrophihabitans sp. TaxID=1932789 RepID=UPI002F193E9B